MAEHINIRLKLVRGNLVILVGLGLEVGWNQIWPLRASLSIDNTKLGGSMGSYGSLSFYLQNAPKSPLSSKSLQNLKTY